MPLEREYLIRRKAFDIQTVKEIEVSQALAFRFNEAGTKFRLYPQPTIYKEFKEPEIVYVNAPPGTIKVGPVDEHIHVIIAINKLPYMDYTNDGTLTYHGKPPYPRNKKVSKPAEPTPEGHFDRLTPGTRQFGAGAAFAAIRCTLEIWAHHFEKPLPWFFEKPVPRRFEMIPYVRSYNAWSGGGYLEFGYPNFPDSRENPFCENFDAVAHETGHLIMKRVIGNPPDDEKSVQYRAHEEAAADLIAVIAALHFDSVLDDELERTKGKLFAVSPISRIMEWGPTKKEEARRVFNNSTMASAREAAAKVPSDLGKKYKLSLPFSGGAFDVLVEIFERNLLERKAIPKRLGELSRGAAAHAISDLRREFARHFEQHPATFREGLLEARDYVARLLARTWGSTPPAGLTYSRVVANMIAADAELSTEVGKGPYTDIIRDSFEARGILPPR